MIQLLGDYRTNPGSVFRSNAAIGGLAWIATWALLRPELVVMILLFAPLVCVPLGLTLLVDRKEGQVSRIWSLLTLAQPFGAAWLIGAFVVPSGWLAAVLTVPWLLVTLISAFLGVQLLVSERLKSPSALSMAAGMIYLAIGGGWTLLARFGARPLEFSDIIVLLTGVHFHYAGFALPVLTGLAGQALRDRISRLAIFGVVSGVPLVAMGITVGRWAPLFEAFAALWMMSASFLVVILQGRLAVRTYSTSRQCLFLLSALSLLAGMILAGVYSVKSYYGQPWLEVDTMIVWHGSINSFGFTLLGLLAWTVVSSKAAADKDSG
ncbi:MAG: YndJ family transporter [Gemmataceae bacterium]